MTNIIDTVTNLISLPHEYEWLDFKENWFSKDEIGEYISLVTIPFNKIDAAPFELNAGEEGNIQKNEKSDQKLHPNCTVTAPETENLHCNCTVNVPEIALKTFMALKENPHATAKDLAKTLDLSLRTIKNHIAILKQNGCIVRIGSDKSGHWEIVEK